MKICQWRWDLFLGYMNHYRRYHNRLKLQLLNHSHRTSMKREQGILTCGECLVAPLVTADFLCCQEFPRIQWRKDQALLLHDLDLRCIINYPAFQTAILDPYALNLVWLEYRQHYRNAYEGEQHKKFRHIAYRQFVRFIWEYLGVSRRVRLPTCVVGKIRSAFPSPDGTYTGFKLPDLPDWHPYQKRLFSEPPNDLKEYSHINNSYNSSKNTGN